MSNVKRFLGAVPLLVLWLLVSIFVWGFVFTRITDAPPAQKITLYVDAETPGDTALAVRLEAGCAVRMAQVRPFTYAMFDGTALERADLYIVRASNVALYRDWFRPLPADMAADDCLTLDGAAWGIPVYVPGGENPAAGQYIDYAPPGAEEPYYLLFGAASLHVEGNEGAVDNEAVTAASILLSLRETKGATR